MTNSQIIYKPFSFYLGVKTKVELSNCYLTLTYVQVGVRASKWPTDNKVTPTIN